MVKSGMSPSLLKRLASGTYVVNELAVAEAILSRSREQRGAPTFSRVLVAGEPFEGPPSGPGESQSGSPGRVP